jgi:hypothetical protein
MESKPPVNLPGFSEKDRDRSLNRRTFLLGAAALVSTAAGQEILRSVDAQAAAHRQIPPAFPARLPLRMASVQRLKEPRAWPAQAVP